MRTRGFTLIELLIALSIAGILLLLAAPSYSVWMSDSQIRTGAQLAADGMRMAFADAIKHNRQTEFVLDPTTKTGGFTIEPVGGTVADGARFDQGADRAQFAVTPAGATRITFTGMGTVAAANADGSAPIQRIDVSTTLAGTRPLAVVAPRTVNGLSGIRICDPYWNTVNPNDPKACP